MLLHAPDVLIADYDDDCDDDDDDNSEDDDDDYGDDYDDHATERLLPQWRFTIKRRWGGNKWGVIKMWEL